MLSILYRASFFLYEISFCLFALALFYHGTVLQQLARAFRLPALAWLSYLAGVLLLVCAGIHFYVYHSLSPQYMQTGSLDQLLQMYALKTVSMFSILIAGLALSLGNSFYLKKTT